MTTIHRPSNVDASKFTFGDVQTNQYGGKSLKIKYNGEDFMFQTPRMRLPYGLGVYEEKDGDGNVIKTKYSLDFSFGGYEENDEGEANKPKVRALYDMMKDLEKKLISSTVENSEEWLGEDELNESAAKILTRDIVKYARDKHTKKRTDRYPPTFKAKIGFYDGRFTLNAFNENKEPIEDMRTACPKGSEAVSIIKLIGLTFAGGKCGYSFRIYQIKIYRPVSLPAYAFIEDDDDETPLTRPASRKEETVKMVVDTSPKLVADSDSDEEDSLDLDDESEEEDLVPTPPEPKKKKIKRKSKKTT